MEDDDERQLLAIQIADLEKYKDDYHSVKKLPLLLEQQKKSLEIAYTKFKDWFKRPNNHEDFILGD